MALSPTASALRTAFFGCAAAAVVAGCEKQISDESIELANKLQESAQQRKSRWPGISEGMTEKEVESILGQPMERRTGEPVTINQPVELPTVTYIYRQNGEAVELSFLDGKLQGRIPKFGEKLDQKAPLSMKHGTAGAPPAQGLSDATSQENR